VRAALDHLEFGCQTHVGAAKRAANPPEIEVGG